MLSWYLREQVTEFEWKSKAESHHFLAPSFVFSAQCRDRIFWVTCSQTRQTHEEMSENNARPLCMYKTMTMFGFYSSLVYCDHVEVSSLKKQGNEDRISTRQPLPYRGNVFLPQWCAVFSSVNVQVINISMKGVFFFHHFATLCNPLSTCAFLFFFWKLLLGYFQSTYSFTHGTIA